MNQDSKAIIYQAENGAIELKGDIANETVWASQKQLSQVFEVDVRTVNEHIKNIFSTGELDADPTIRKFRIVQKEGSREVSRSVDHYNLDMIISVGYRVNSKTATKFRKWATKALNQHITQGFTINPLRIEKNLDSFLQAVDKVRSIAFSNSGNSLTGADDVLSLVKSFAYTWFSLESFDEDNLSKTGLTRKDIQLEVDALYEAVAQFKTCLINTLIVFKINPIELIFNSCFSRRNIFLFVK